MGNVLPDFVSIIVQSMSKATSLVAVLSCGNNGCILRQTFPPFAQPFLRDNRISCASSSRGTNFCITSIFPAPKKEGDDDDEDDDEDEEEEDDDDDDDDDGDDDVMFEEALEYEIVEQGSGSSKRRFLSVWPSASG